jgi:glycosidase
MMEFHIARKARERYQFAETLFSYSGNVIFANIAACREFAFRINQVREVDQHPAQAVHAGQLYAMGLIDEASHVLIARYREQFDPQVMTGAIDWFSSIVGAEALGKMLLTFVENFPGISVMRGEQKPLEWLAGQTDGISHYAVAFEELMLLWTANRNEAFQPFEELFEEKTLAEKTVYRQVTKQLPEYFATRPLIPLPNAKKMNLLELLRAPAVGAPRSLSEQLNLIRKMWKPLLGESLEEFLRLASEILHEEELAIWMQFNPDAANAAEAARRHKESGEQQWPSVVSTADVPDFDDQVQEYEKFSPDMAWMPTAVLIAKSTYVWLGQMSKQYGRRIAKLDEIPDEELATLARRGLNSLWLIGVWERSRASKTIKQLCGNTDAVASAYSLFDYTIAEDLGGEAAYTNLRDRAYRHGIRLASDMVPNHMGIDSPWVIEHPDWFISRPEPPYPAYTFNGPDLSHDGRVEIKIEDHYFEQSDAAVVFRRRDQQSGETRYIYHGNDGTSFPWNDTAQLDYLNPAVREQVIQTILHVARLFPVIRFDAAMTLAKRHFHRLWFPGQGSSGAIPSRAENGMSQADFDRAMPQEFWREVVDRVAAEVPGTLLLAEAFWLMEGYFVRTLGMHRVYNSAFMNMMRDEENAKYRSVIKNTLEFDPDIMKRYVNFMSNPDERTAIDQFGKGDKCFGVAAMMATLPGLPMFGHGQIEGFTEKYGMEYQRARYDETPDHWMVERHEREIAPLLQRRRLFAESTNFLLYDFFLDAGTVDENVFAYSNRRGNERALVVYNNRYGETHGTIDYSAAYADKESNQLRQQRIREGLGFSDNSGAILGWRDSLTGLEYLRRASDLASRGLTLDLHAYQCHVFLNWRELYATAEQPWDRLCDQLNGRGVPNLQDALVNLELQPVHDALRQLLEPALVRLFADLAEHPRTLAVGVNKAIETERTEFFEAAWVRCENFLWQAQRAYVMLTRSEAATLPANPVPANPSLLRAAYRERLRAAMRIPSVEALFPVPWTVAARRMLPSPSPQLTATAMWGPVLGWCALELLAESIDVQKPERVALELFDRLRLREPFARAFAALGFNDEEGWRVAARVKVGLLTAAEIGKPEKAEATTAEVAPALWPALWSDADVRWLTGVHPTEGHDYLVRERYEELLWWLLMPSLLRLAGEVAPSRLAVQAMSKNIEEALATAEAAGYRVDLLAPVAAEVGSKETATKAVVVAKPADERDAEPVGPEAQAKNEPDAKIEAAEPPVEPAVEARPLKAETVADAQTSTVEQHEPVSPEIEAEAETVAEAEVTDQPAEPVADAHPVPVDEPEPEESEIAAKVEPVAEPEALDQSTEPAVEAQPLPVVEETPTEPEIEAETTPVVEPETLDQTTEAAVEAQPLLVVEETPTEPEIEAETTHVVEPETAHQPAEPMAEAHPLPVVAQEPTEPEIQAEAVVQPAEPVAQAHPVYVVAQEPATYIVAHEPAAHIAAHEPATPAPEAAPEPVVEFETAVLPAADDVGTAGEVPENDLAKTEIPADSDELMRWLLKPKGSSESSPAAVSEEEYLSEEQQAPLDPARDLYILQTDQQQLTEPEIEVTDDPEAEWVAEQDPEDAEREREYPEDHPSGAKTLVDSITSIFARKPELLTEPSIFGLRDAQPSSTDPSETTTPKDEFTSGSAVEPEAHFVRSADAYSSFTERWEPPAPEIHYTAKPAGESTGESEWPAPAPPPNIHLLRPATPEADSTDRDNPDNSTLPHRG